MAGVQEKGRGGDAGKRPCAVFAQGRPQSCSGSLQVVGRLAGAVCLLHGLQPTFATPVQLQPVLRLRLSLQVGD